MTPLHYRLLGHTASLSMHLINGAVMTISIKDEEVMKDPRIQELAFMQFRFITVWNILFQVSYAVLSLACDLLTLINKDYLLLTPVKQFRNLFFTCIVFPGSLLVFSLFWPFFLYDREIVFPAFIDKVFSLESNLIMHLCIVPVVLWELVFLPRRQPKSHKMNLGIVSAYFLIYNAFILHTYFEKGIWPYPLMGIIYGTIYNPIFHAYVYSLCIACYYVQWPLLNFFWGKKAKKNKIK